MVVLFMSSALAASPSDLHGSWTFSGGSEQASVVESKREEIAQTFNFALRPIVRSKLAKPMNVDDGIHITASEEQVEVRYSGAYPRSFVLQRKGDVYTDGGTLTLRQEGDDWVLDGATEDGGMVRRFDVSGSTLTVTSLLYSPQLEGKPSWSLSYTKQ